MPTTLTLAAIDVIIPAIEVVAPAALGGLLDKTYVNQLPANDIKRCDLHDTKHSLFAVGRSTAVEECWVGIVDNLGD